MIGAEPQLVEAARSGDVAAVERLLVVCQPDLRRFARRTCSSGEDAEDAVQIALWQLYRKIGALRAAATFATWMFRIIERECYRLFRVRSRLQALDDSLWTRCCSRSRCRSNCARISPPRSRRCRRSTARC